MTYQKKEHPKGEEEYDWTCHVGVVHYSFVYWSERVEDCHRLYPNMGEVDPELWYEMDFQHQVR
jgi:hypothetical protein